MSVAGGAAPYSANGSRADQAASRAGSGVAGRWQKTFTWSGAAGARARVSAIAFRAPSGVLEPTPSAPRPPARETAAAMAGVETPAIGA
ncbi:MAG: hypothetical protein U0270_21245 [Labilithrix sp.]